MEGFKSYFGTSGAIEMNLIGFIKNAFIYYTVGNSCSVLHLMSKPLMAIGISTLCEIRYRVFLLGILCGVHERKINSVARFQREVLKFSDYLRIADFPFLK